MPPDLRGTWKPLLVLPVLVSREFTFEDAGTVAYSGDADADLGRTSKYC